MKKFYFRSNSPCITCLFLFLQEEQVFKKSKIWVANYGTSWGHSRGVGQTCFSNSTHKHMKRNYRLVNFYSEC